MRQGWPVITVCAARCTVPGRHFCSAPSVEYALEGHSHIRQPRVSADGRAAGMRPALLFVAARSPCQPNLKSQTGRASGDNSSRMQTYCLPAATLTNTSPERAVALFRKPAPTSPLEASPPSPPLLPIPDDPMRNICASTSTHPPALPALLCSSLPSQAAGSCVVRLRDRSACRRDGGARGHCLRPNLAYARHCLQCTSRVG